MLTPKLCLITGANGYLGSVLKAALEAKGFEVRALVRKPTQSEDIYFELGRDVSELAQALALIHCAYDFTPLDWPEISRVNVRGSEKLFTAAKAAGIKKLIFISSMSAFPECKSLYGRSKLEVEKIVLQLGGTVIRPGMVYGADSGGMVGKLAKLVSKFKIIPLVGGSQKLYLSHEEDLAALVSLLLERDLSNFPKLITAANKEPLTFSGVIHELAERIDKSPIIISAPWKPLWLVLSSLEKFGVRLGFKSDSLISLMNTNPAPDFSALEELGVSFRPFSE